MGVNQEEFAGFVPGLGLASKSCVSGRSCRGQQWIDVVGFCNHCSSEYGVHIAARRCGHPEGGKPKQTAAENTIGTSFANHPEPTPSEARHPLGPVGRFKAPANEQSCNSLPMATIDAKIEQVVESRIQELKQDQDEQMMPQAQSSWEPRIQQLEQQINQLHASNQALQAGQHTIVAKSETFEKKLEYLNKSMENQAQQFTQAVDHKLNDNVEN